MALLRNGGNVKMGKQRGGKSMVFLRVIAALIVIFLAALFFASGIFTFPRYLEPWQKKYAQQFEDPRLRLIAHGLLAANGHNMQPWKVRLDRNDSAVFYLYADSERLTKEVDPFARQTMISQGTFLEYVKVAGEKLGYKTDIVLFPEGNYDERDLAESMKAKPVAKIMITKGEPKNNSLYNFMYFPDTNRAAYKDIQLSYDQIDLLQATNTDKEISIKIFQDAENLRKLGNYVAEGAKIESQVHRINEEAAKLFRTNEYQKNRLRYGFSIEGQGASGIMKHIMQGFVTLVPSLNNEKTSADTFVASTRMAVENTPAYAMIITNNNDRISQVEAGMLYSRLVLTAHSLGLVMQPPSQVLEEYPEMKDLYNDIHSDYASEGGTIQMLLRVGNPTKDFPQSMRRDVMDLII
jgi:hypothetical protein